MLKDIYDAQFLTLYANESKNASHNETSSVFVTYLSSTEHKIKTTFLGIVNFKGKMAAEIMDVAQKFFTAKSLTIDTILFSVLDRTNSMSGKRNGQQRRIRYNLPFNIYSNCRNHCLALCLPHLMKSICLGEIMNDYDTLLLGLLKIFHFSPKHSSILESFQVIYGKKPLKILKAAVTHWLTHSRASECVLDCLLEILEALNKTCIGTNESEVRGYRNLLMDHKVLFFICLMADILKRLNTLSSVLQKQGAPLVDIKHVIG